jgi:hypothetical protein
MTNPLPPASPEEITKWVRDAAAETPWRPGHKLSAGPAPVSDSRGFHFTIVEAALNRARLKTFVPGPKPFRGLRRNQAAVNESLIEAVHYLSAQTQELKQELNELRRIVGNLRRQAATAEPQRDGRGEEQTGAEPPNTCA